MAGVQLYKNSMKSQKGFTIIELIVVIAIIAVLSSIVLANVTKYTGKGRDAAIKGQISEIRTAATDFFISNGTYTGMCSSGPCYNAKNNIANLGGLLGNNQVYGAIAYCMDFKLSDKVTLWCVDSSGYVGPQDSCGTYPNSCTGS